MRIFLITLLTFCFYNTLAKFNNQNINNFIVKENLLKNNKVAIIATDSLENPIETINGVFNFSINGFKQQLQFNNGVAVCPLQIEKSAFIFVKHVNEIGSHSNLYYVYKKDTDLNPYKISWYLLLIIPIGLIMIGYLFKKFIGFIIFILLALLYFNFSKGLSLPTFFQSIFDGMRNMF